MMIKRFLTSVILAALTLLPASAQFRPTVAAQSETESASGAVEWLVGPVTESTPKNTVLRVPEYPQVHSLHVEVANDPATCTVELEGSLILSPTSWPSLSGSQNCASGTLFHVVNKAATYLRANITALTAAEVLDENALTTHVEWDTTTGFDDTGGNAVFSHSPTEVLDELDFSTHVNWDVTGDFDDTGGNATYTHATGSGTLTQVEGDQANAPTSGSLVYEFDYVVSSFSGDVACDITTAWASTTVALTMSDGAQTTEFTSASNPGDFVISCTSTSGAVTLDDVSLQLKEHTATLTQVEADQLNAPTSGGHSYTFTYDVASPSGTVSCEITSAWASTATALDLTADTGKTVTFTSASNPGDFVISCTSTSSGGVTFDNLFLSSNPTATVYYLGLGQ